MRNISNYLQNHISQDVINLATCFLLTLQSDKKLGFTDYIEDLQIDNITYVAKSGLAKTAIDSNSDFSNDNLEVEAILEDDSINEKDVLAGIYNMAKIEIFLVNYLNPDAGKILLKSGYFSEIKLENGKFITEIQGLNSMLNNNILDKYSNNCSANFGDEKCKLTPLKAKGYVSKIISSDSWLDYSRLEEKSYFNNGCVKFTTGANKGLSFEIKNFDKQKITTCFNITYNLNENDEYEITTGCDKSFKTCCEKFANAINFRGQPHVLKVHL